MNERTTEQHDPVLSIVIVTTDGTEDTIDCLESIYRNPPNDSLEVILVDNASTEPAHPVVHAKYPQVRIFSVPQRQGFAKNYNLGMRQTKGKYVMILNDDTIVHAGALDALVSAIRKNKSYGMVGPKLLSTNGQIQTVCARRLETPFSYVLKQLVFDLGMPTGRLWDRYLRWKLKKRASGPVQCINGACMLASWEVLHKIGLLDEGYDFYYEDIEWCHRVIDHGLEVAYIAEAPITHIGDQTMSKLREWGKKKEYFGAMRYFNQYYDISTVQKWMLWAATVLGYFLRACVYGVIESVTKKQGYARVYRRLLRWIVAQTPTKVVT